MLLLIAGSSHKEQAQQIRFLKVENKMLRGKLLERITVTAKELQRLLKYRAKLGKAIHQLVAIVKPDTFLRWIREGKRANQKRRKFAKRGRSRMPEQIRADLVHGQGEHFGL